MELASRFTLQRGSHAAEAAQRACIHGKKSQASIAGWIIHAILTYSRTVCALQNPVSRPSIASRTCAVTYNRRMANGEWRMNNKQRTTNNKRRRTLNDEQRTTTNIERQRTTRETFTTNNERRPTTNDDQRPTTNDQRTTNNDQRPTNELSPTVRSRSQKKPVNGGKNEQ